MTEETQSSNEDPLVAALPPAMDYITYLTLLEYQLNPANLHTLNRLLSEDDGTLAKEIGWDLLRLVLPMLGKAPEAASNSLDIIARRGNPREVVVRLAEELERLGHTSFEEEDSDEEAARDDDDNLPTFQGEAKRIHLGEMKLAGMPDSIKKENDGAEGEQASRTEDSHVDSTIQDQSSFKALLSMLAVVHPRIKTQYPSRFLATSLPAALGAYRRIPTSHAATVAFLNCLKDLSGKQKPELPPRSTSAPGPDLVAAYQSGSTAPLPDPEASGGEVAAAAGTNDPSSNEEAINVRLLQAVLLEVLEEFMTSLQIQEIPSMSWTSRLREKLEPKRVMPGRETETELWNTDEDLKLRDDLVNKFVALAGELGIDPLIELGPLIAPEPLSTGSMPAKPETEEEEPSEYPRWPSDVPFTLSAIVLLAAAAHFTKPANEQQLGLDLMSNLLTQVTILPNGPELPSPALQDALLSLLYHSVMHSKPISPVEERTMTNLISMLIEVCKTCPQPQLRDDAYHIATKLFHDFCTPQVRLWTIKAMLKANKQSASASISPAPIEGVLSAIPVDWLKEETLKYNAAPAEQVSTSDTTVSNSGIAPSILVTDSELATMLLAPATSIQENGVSRTNILLMLPYYISVLNLCCVVLGNSVSTQDDLRDKVVKLQASLSSWLQNLLPQITTSEEAQLSAPELFALEDASQRLTEIFGRKKESAV